MPTQGIIVVAYSGYYCIREVVSWWVCKTIADYDTQLSLEFLLTKSLSIWIVCGFECSRQRNLIVTCCIGGTGTDNIGISGHHIVRGMQKNFLAIFMTYWSAGEFMT